MSKNIQAIRGMHDVLPDQTPLWQKLEHAIRQIMDAYSYQEIRMPIVEKTELFVRTIGEVTDIVEKEMYSFEDRNGDSLTLRPEGTASCVRACIENNLLRGQTPRYWYMGPMFRHERPQKGRYRQFNQVGVEAFGLDGPEIDVELILMTARLWRLLGIQGLELQINSLGNSEARANYRRLLIEYMSSHLDQLDEDSKRRLQTNPLRILDSKNSELQNLIQHAPKLSDCLDSQSAEHFERLKSILDTRGIPYTVNPRLVRGLDYYERTVFEWVSDRLGAQGTVCAGGRYDGLVEMLGGKSTPAAGFALGLERLITLFEEAGVDNANTRNPHIYLVKVGDQASQLGLELAEKLRDECSWLRIRVDCDGGSFKSQLKKADKSGAIVAFILGEDEVASDQISIKYLREDRQQQTIDQSSLVDYISDHIKH